MSPHFKSLLILMGLLLALTANAYSDVIWGTGYLDRGGWDFSEQISTHPDLGDIHFIRTVIANKASSILELFIYANYGAKIAVIPDSTFEQLIYAPPDTSSLYGSHACVLSGLTYVVRTCEGHYAKFKFIAYNPWQRIEYVYQPDGSRWLFDPTGVECNSWSRIKSMFSR